jgi:hypothetical protein
MAAIAAATIPNFCHVFIGSNYDTQIKGWPSGTIFEEILNDQASTSTPFQNAT